MRIVQGSRMLAARGEHWTAFIRCIWLLFAILVLTLFVVSLPISFDYIRDNCYAHQCNGGPPPALTTLQPLGIGADAYALSFTVFDAICVLVYLVIAAFLIWRKPREHMAVLGACALLLWGTTITQSLQTMAMVQPFWSPLINVLAFLGLASFTFFIYLFPDGRFVPRWSYWVALIPVVAFLPGSIWPGSPADSQKWPQAWVGVVIVIWMGGIIATQVFRYRYASNALQRQQTRWVLVGIAAATLCVITAGGLPLIIWPDIATTGSAVAYMFNYTGIRAGMLLIPLTIGIAILRNRLWNIDLILHRALVYGGLTASVVGMYIIVVGYFSIGFKIGNNPLISLLATGIIAIAFQPLREQLQRRVNRLIYGQRDEPHTLLARLGEQLEHALTPQTVLPMLVETIASALKLPFAAIALRYADSEMIVATYGTPQQECTRFPLTYQSETVGDLLVAPRSPGEAFVAADHRLFTVLAGQASMAAYSLRLTNELQQMTIDLLHSRAQLVGTREEERRRLRRELHDGVGPTLASLLQRIDATQYLVHEDPDAAIARLKDLKTQVRTTVADIRQLVYALRPPTIDELGLLSAIREHVMQAARKECIVHIEATPEPLPALPAAVEIAAYRIVLEAFTNVQLHAHATTCDICLNTEDTADGQVLTVTVADNGRGLPPEYHTGVGMLSMRERSSELGGNIQFAPEERSGLLVRARLPFPTIPTSSLTRAQGEDIHGDKRKREHNTTADR